MALSPTIPYMDMTLADLKLFLKPSEKDKTLVLIIQGKEFKLIGKTLIPMKTGETGLFQKMNISSTLASAKLLLKTKQGDNLKVFLSDRYLYEVINPTKIIKIGKAI